MSRPSIAEAVLARVVGGNNARIERVALDRGAPNPRPTAGLGWNAELERAWPAIRAEWDGFADGGGRLPRIEEVIDEHQGNAGPWRAGLLVARGRPATELARSFPVTVAALARVPGLWSALWSVMEPGTELPEHRGPNAGVLRYHLGVRCPEGAALEVCGRVVPYEDGVGILFDDTAPHAAWNRAAAERVTLFVEVLRPLPPWDGWRNRRVQALVALDPRYRRAAGRADRWRPWE